MKEAKNTIVKYLAIGASVVALICTVLVIDVSRAQTMDLQLSGLSLDFSSTELTFAASTTAGNNLWFSDVQLANADCELHLGSESSSDVVMLGSIVVSQQESIGLGAVQSTFNVEWKETGVTARHYILEALQGLSSMSLLTTSCSATVNVHFGGVLPTSISTNFEKSMDLNDMMTTTTEAAPIDWSADGWDMTVSKLSLDLLIEGTSLRNQIQAQIPTLETLELILPDLSFSIMDKRRDGNNLGYNMEVVGARYNLLSGQDQTLTFTMQCIQNGLPTFYPQPLLEHLYPELLILDATGDSFLMSLIDLHEFDLVAFFYSLMDSSSVGSLADRRLLQASVDPMVQLFPEWDGVHIGSTLTNNSASLVVDIVLWGTSSVEVDFGGIRSYLSSSSSYSSYSYSSSANATSSSTYSSSTSSWDFDFFPSVEMYLFDNYMFYVAAHGMLSNMDGIWDAAFSLTVDDVVTDMVEVSGFQVPGVSSGGPTTTGWQNCSDSTWMSVYVNSTQICLFDWNCTTLEFSGDVAFDYAAPSASTSQWTTGWWSAYGSSTWLTTSFSCPWLDMDWHMAGSFALVTDGLESNAISVTADKMNQVFTADSSIVMFGGESFDVVGSLTNFTELSLTGDVNMTASLDIDAMSVSGSIQKDSFEEYFEGSLVFPSSSSTYSPANSTYSPANSTYSPANSTYSPTYSTYSYSSSSSPFGAQITMTGSFNLNGTMDYTWDFISVDIVEKDADSPQIMELHLGINQDYNNTSSELFSLESWWLNALGEEEYYFSSSTRIPASYSALAIDGNLRIKGEAQDSMISYDLTGDGFAANVQLSDIMSAEVSFSSATNQSTSSYNYYTWYGNPATRFNVNHMSWDDFFMDVSMGRNNWMHMTGDLEIDNYWTMANTWALAFAPYVKIGDVYMNADVALSFGDLVSVGGSAALGNVSSAVEWVDGNFLFNQTTDAWWASAGFGLDNREALDFVASVSVVDESSTNATMVSVEAAVSMHELAPAVDVVTTTVTPFDVQTFQSLTVNQVWSYFDGTTINGVGHFDGSQWSSSTIDGMYLMSMDASATQVSSTCTRQFFNLSDGALTLPDGNFLNMDGLEDFFTSVPNISFPSLSVTSCGEFEPSAFWDMPCDLVASSCMCNVVNCSYCSDENNVCSSCDFGMVLTNGACCSPGMTFSNGVCSSPPPEVIIEYVVLVSATLVDMTLETFTEEAQTLFVSGLAASLGVDSDTVTIISISEGSVIVDYEISGFSDFEAAQTFVTDVVDVTPIVLDATLGAAIFNHPVVESQEVTPTIETAISAAPTSTASVLMAALIVVMLA